MAGGASAVKSAPGCSAANGRRELKQDKTDALETLPSRFATIRERVCGVLEFAIGRKLRVTVVHCIVFAQLKQGKAQVRWPEARRTRLRRSWKAGIGSAAC